MPPSTAAPAVYPTHGRGFFLFCQTPRLRIDCHRCPPPPLPRSCRRPFPPARPPPSPCRRCRRSRRRPSYCPRRLPARPPWSTWRRSRIVPPRPSSCSRCSTPAPPHRGDLAKALDARGPGAEGARSAGRGRCGAHVVLRHTRPLRGRRSGAARRTAPCAAADKPNATAADFGWMGGLTSGEPTRACGRIGNRRPTAPAPPPNPPPTRGEGWVGAGADPGRFGSVRPQGGLLPPAEQVKRRSSPYPAGRAPRLPPVFHLEVL